jgi:putative two-component system response regulator
MSIFADMRVLVVDDNATNLELIQQILERAGYKHVVGTQDARGVAHLCDAGRPDLVLLDLHMPRFSGYEVMGEIRELMSEPESLPVLVVTADSTVEARHRVLSMGARGLITKPIDQAELLLRTHNLLHTRDLQHRLEQRNLILDQAVNERTAELEHARVESLTMLAAVGEYHDDDTGQHTQRVGQSAERVARALGLPGEFASLIRDAAPLHDIGKISIPRSLLQKPGALTPEERQIMMRHAEAGAQILSSASSPVLCLAAQIARSHHEHWDGGGYPDGLAGENIPLAARITAVGDVFDALTHERPYKPAWEIGRSLAHIKDRAGSQFDPRVVEAFLTLAPSELGCLDRDGLQLAALTDHRSSSAGTGPQPGARTYRDRPLAVTNAEGEVV